MSVQLPPPNYEHKDIASRIRGYRAAAELLASDIESRGASERSAHEEPLLLPTIHVHRHYLELLLKALVEDTGVTWPQGHDLLPLWQRIRAMANDDDIQTMGDADTLFWWLDEMHFSDRYSRDRRTGRAYPEWIERTTLKGFRELFVPVAAHLEFAAKLWLFVVAR